MCVARSALRFSLFASTIFLISILITGCGQLNSSSTPAPSPSPENSEEGTSFLYITEANTSSIEAFAISASGAVSAVSGSPFKLPQAPIGIARSGEFLFIGSVAPSVRNPLTRSITTFRINPGTGSLSQIASMVTSATSNLSVSPNGRFLYSGGVNVFAISPAGRLSAISGSPFTSPPLSDISAPLSFSPTGHFFYSVASPLTTGAATWTGAVAETDPQTGAVHDGQILNLDTVSLGVTPDGNAMVATSQDPALQNQLCTFSIDPRSGLMSGVVISCATAPDPLDRLAIAPTGNFIAATAPNAVYLFGLNNGQLSVPAGPFFLTTQPSLVRFSRDGKFLFVAGAFNSGPINELAVFKVDSTAGALIPVSGSPFPLRSSPWVMTP
jgi:hypothetical protein